jgi:hypothetical protein
LGRNCGGDAEDRVDEVWAGVGGSDPRAVDVGKH